MSSNNSTNNTKVKNSYIMTYETSPTTNTTFVHAEPSTFRAVVQQLTGSSAAVPAIGTPPSATTSFKLHERRQAAAMRKLEMIKLNNNNSSCCNNYYGPSPHSNNGLGLVSPVSTLDGLGYGLASPRTPGTMVNEDEERAIIAEKGFYLHPVSPNFNTHYPRDSQPQLLPLFPLHSPRDDHDRC